MFPNVMPTKFLVLDLSLPITVFILSPPVSTSENSKGKRNSVSSVVIIGLCYSKNFRVNYHEQAQTRNSLPLDFIKLILGINCSKQNLQPFIIPYVQYDFLRRLYSKIKYKCPKPYSCFQKYSGNTSSLCTFQYFFLCMQLVSCDLQKLFILRIEHNQFSSQNFLLNHFWENLIISSVKYLT